MVEQATAPSRIQVPTTVVLERQIIQRGLWSVPSWRLRGVLVGTTRIDPAAERQPLRDTDLGTEYAWAGYTVTFYKDACERYWHALIGNKPLVYVVCRPSEDEREVTPLVVTCDYDEATAFSETDDLVLSREIPGELYRVMERFVVTHYKPAPFKKRRRKRWVEQPT